MVLLLKTVGSSALAHARAQPGGPSACEQSPVIVDRRDSPWRAKRRGKERESAGRTNCCSKAPPRRLRRAGRENERERALVTASSLCGTRRGGRRPLLSWARRRARAPARLGIAAHCAALRPHSPRPRRTALDGDTRPPLEYAHTAAARPRPAARSAPRRRDGCARAGPARRESLGRAPHRRLRNSRRQRVSFDSKQRSRGRAAAKERRCAQFRSHIHSPRRASRRRPQQQQQQRAPPPPAPAPEPWPPRPRPPWRAAWRAPSCAPPT